jgi:hypothetical protein
VQESGKNNQPQEPLLSIYTKALGDEALPKKWVLHEQCSIMANSSSPLPTASNYERGPNHSIIDGQVLHEWYYFMGEYVALALNYLGSRVVRLFVLQVSRHFR